MWQFAPLSLILACSFITPKTKYVLESCNFWICSIERTTYLCWTPTLTFGEIHNYVPINVHVIILPKGVQLCCLISAGE